MTGVGWTSGLVRTNDPPESHEAAARVSAKVARDRLLVLDRLEHVGRATAREIAQGLVGTTNTARLESLRRRVSDLKALGWAEQVGRYNGQAEFRVTDAGRAVLAGGVS